MLPLSDGHWHDAPSPSKLRAQACCLGERQLEVLNPPRCAGSLRVPLSAIVAAASESDASAALRPPRRFGRGMNMRGCFCSVMQVLK